MTAPAGGGAGTASDVRKPSSSNAELCLEGLRYAVLLHDAEDVRTGLLKVMPSWPVRSITKSRLKSPNGSRVTKAPSGYAVMSRYLSEPIDRLGVAGAVCCVTADIAQAFVEERRGFTALHCGAFTLAGRLFAVSGPARAGKSTLIARLSAEPGISVLCDDVLPLSPAGDGYGLGIAPRLRLPLPANTREDFASHVRKHAAIEDARYVYLATPSLAAHGVRLPLSVLLVLNRQRAVSAKIERLSSAEAVHHLLRQSIRAELDTAVFARLEPIARRLSCYLLTYSDVEDATITIKNAFSGRELPPLPMAELQPAHQKGPRPRRRDASRFFVRQWRRHPAVAMRLSGGATLLWHSAYGTTFQLNAIAAAVWNLLGEAQSGNDVAQALATAFPSVKTATIRADLHMLAAALIEEELIVPDCQTGKSTHDPAARRKGTGVSAR